MRERWEEQRDGRPEGRTTNRNSAAVPRALNETTQRTLAFTDAGRGLVRCQNAEDMFRRLGI